MTALRPGTSPPPVRMPMRFFAMHTPVLASQNNDCRRPRFPLRCSLLRDLQALGRRALASIPTTIASGIICRVENNSGREGKNPMRQKLLVLVTLLALAGGGSSSRAADTQELERVLDQWVLAWSSSDVERLLPLSTDSVDYEDV